MENTPAPLDNIVQVAFTVQDLARSKEFYQQKLGLRPLFDAGTMAFFQCGGVRFMIGTSDKPLSCAGAILYFGVGDIHAAHETLRARGVVFEQAPHVVARMAAHDVWLALLRDPDGNALGLMAEVPRAAA